MQNMAPNLRSGGMEMEPETPVRKLVFSDIENDVEMSSQSSSSQGGVGWGLQVGLSCDYAKKVLTAALTSDEGDPPHRFQISRAFNSGLDLGTESRREALDKELLVSTKSSLSQVGWGPSGPSSSQDMPSLPAKVSDTPQAISTLSAVRVDLEPLIPPHGNKFEVSGNTLFSRLRRAFREAAPMQPVEPHLATHSMKRTSQPVDAGNPHTVDLSCLSAESLHSDNKFVAPDRTSVSQFRWAFSQDVPLKQEEAPFENRIDLDAPHTASVGGPFRVNPSHRLSESQPLGNGFEAPGRALSSEPRWALSEDSPMPTDGRVLPNCNELGTLQTAATKNRRKRAPQSLQDQPLGNRFAASLETSSSEFRWAFSDDAPVQRAGSLLTKSKEPDASQPVAMGNFFAKDLPQSPQAQPLGNRCAAKLKTSSSEFRWAFSDGAPAQHVGSCLMKPMERGASQRAATGNIFAKDATQDQPLGSRCAALSSKFRWAFSDNTSMQLAVPQPLKRKEPDTSHPAMQGDLLHVDLDNHPSSKKRKTDLPSQSPHSFFDLQQQSAPTLCPNPEKLVTQHRSASTSSSDFALQTEALSGMFRDATQQLSISHCCPMDPVPTAAPRLLGTDFHKSTQNIRSFVPHSLCEPPTAHVQKVARPTVFWISNAPTPAARQQLLNSEIETPVKTLPSGLNSVLPYAPKQPIQSRAQSKKTKLRSRGVEQQIDAVNGAIRRLHGQSKICISFIMSIVCYCLGPMETRRHAFQQKAACIVGAVLDEVRKQDEQRIHSLEKTIEQKKQQLEQLILTKQKAEQEAALKRQEVSDLADAIDRANAACERPSAVLDATRQAKELNEKKIEELTNMSQTLQDVFVDCFVPLKHYEKLTTSLAVQHISKVSQIMKSFQCEAALLSGFHKAGSHRPSTRGLFCQSVMEAVQSQIVQYVQATEDEHSQRVELALDLQTKARNAKTTMARVQQDVEHANVARNAKRKELQDATERLASARLAMQDMQDFIISLEIELQQIQHETREVVSSACDAYRWLQTHNITGYAPPCRKEAKMRAYANEVQDKIAIVCQGLYNLKILPVECEDMLISCVSHCLGPMPTERSKPQDDANQLVGEALGEQ